MPSAANGLADNSPRDHRPFDWPVLALGIASMCLGVLAIFVSSSDAGAAALVTVGAAAALIGSLGDRLASLKVGDLEIVLRRKADEARRTGDMEAAEVFRAAADTVSRRAATTARDYKSRRSSMPAGLERTIEMDKIIAAAMVDAHAQDLDEENVLVRLWTGSEGLRVWALAVLLERPDLATVRAVLEALERPDHMFDQYYALLLAEEFIALPSNHGWARDRVIQAVESKLARQDYEGLGTDNHSIEVAERIVARKPRA